MYRKSGEEPLLKQEFPKKEATGDINEKMFNAGFDIDENDPRGKHQRWRYKELVDDIVSAHLLSFSLKYTPVADASLERWIQAAKAVYTTDKYENRGEFGELLLHSVLKDFYGTEILVSKIFYKDGPNDTVKGFDAVHVTIAEDNSDIDLWLGEVKFYDNKSSAIRDITKEIIDHLSIPYLKNELMFVRRKIDDADPLKKVSEKIFAKNVSLKDKVKRIIIPALITYESVALQKGKCKNTDYKADLEREFTESIEKFNSNLKNKLLFSEVKIIFIIVPLVCKSDLQKYFDTKLKKLQDL